MSTTIFSFVSLLFSMISIELKIPTFSSYWFVLFCTFNTGELGYTASKEIRAPESMFSSERTPQLSITYSKVSSHYTLLSATVCSVHYTVLHNRRSASAINSVTRKKTDNSHAPTINY